MNTGWARYGSLAVAATAAWSAIRNAADERMSTALFVVALITFGCWLTLEIHALLKNPDHHIYDTPEDSDAADRVSTDE